MSEVGYEEFGRLLVAEIVTADRVKETLEATVAGDFDTEVKIAGGIVRATGSGNVWRIDADRLAGEPFAFRAYLHTDLDLIVRVSGVPYRYSGKAMIVLALHVTLRDDLSIFIEVPDTTEADVTLELTPLGRVAGILDQIGGVSDQVRREIVRFANARKDEPAALAARVIELGPTIEEEWNRRRG